MLALVQFKLRYYNKIIEYIKFRKTFMKQVRIFKGFWTVKDVKYNQQYLFIFGDNELKKGKKGQAIIRDQINAMGIPTKKQPTIKNNAYYSDNQFVKNKNKIDDSIKEIQKRLNQDENLKGIILPQNKIGTGLAKLNDCAPKTYKYLQFKINELVQKLTKKQ